MSVFRAGTNKSSVNNFPSIRPTLDLDFANSKTLDPRITFTRASGGSYVGADGLIKYAGVNEPRFDHDPETSESLGLLIEESRTNLVLNSLSGYSNLFPQNATITTGIDAPDGSNTAVRVSGRTTGPTLIRMNTSTLSNNVRYTISFYVRLISEGTSVSNTLVSDLCDGASINYLPLLVRNKWVKITYSGFRGQTNAPALNFIDLLSDNPNNYTLDFWGAQLEVGSFPTSYIPTQGTTRTRAADYARIVGKDFTDFYNYPEGTAYFSFRSQVQETRYLTGISDFSTRHLIYIRTTASGSDSAIRTNCLEQAYESIAYPRNNLTLSKHAVSYRENDFIVSAQGQISTPDTSCKMPIPTTISIGSIYNDAHINGTVGKVIYYPKRLPNLQLQQLTR